MKEVFSRADWWTGQTIYQIYPRSFYDTNGDGIGDLRGIAEKLSYIKSLGVSGVWICPFYEGPMKDFGYDISNYRQVSPLFGSNEDFADLLKKAHQYELKVIVDLVINHTSDQHEWFKASVEDPKGPYGDYYVWVSSDRVPNNWLSVFGGSSWEWNKKRQQFYFHNFLPEQPDLNLHHPEVQNELLDVARYWLEMGVDGFRLDACNCYFHDPSLKNNPTSPSKTEKVQDETNPYFKQVHLYDKSRPENYEFLYRLRNLVDQYENRFLLGEIFCEREEQTTASYAGPGAPLHSAYNFSLLTNEKTPGLVRGAVSRYFSIAKGTAWSFSNHDVVRVVSRWKSSGELSQKDLARLYLTILVGLPGTIILYQGEELGLSEAKIPRELVQDPFGLRMSGDFPGRDGCRTPIPWKNKHEHHRELVPSWLPIPSEHLPLSVAEQDGVDGSTLELARKLFNYRKENPVLGCGDIHFWQDDENLLAYSRSHQIAGKEQSVLVVCSFASFEIKLLDIYEGKVQEELSRGIILSSEGVLTLAPGGSGIVEFEGTTGARLP